MLIRFEFLEVPNFESIIFSGGRIGLQVQVSLSGLAELVRYQLADVITDLIHH